MVSDLIDVIVDHHQVSGSAIIPDVIPDLRHIPTDLIGKDHDFIVGVSRSIGVHLELVTSQNKPIFKDINRLYSIGSLVCWADDLNRFFQ